MYNTTTVFTHCDFRDEDRMFLEGMHLVEEAYENYQPMTFFEEYITEAFGKKKAGNAKEDTPSSPASQEPKTPAQPTNTASEEKARKGILKLIDAVLGIIRKIKDTVSEFIAKRRLSETERKAYEQFKEMMKKDPAMANKKIRVRDFKEIQKRYQQFMNECEREYEAVAKNAEHPIDKLLEKGKIGILDQSDGNNTVTGTSKIYSTSSYVQPEGKLYYQYRFVVPLVACVCTVLVGWGIFSYIDYLKIPVLQPLPRVEYIWFAVAIVVIFVICYILFPSGNWNKRACLHIIGKSKYTDKDMLHYTVSGCTDKYSVRLTDTSNDIVIPINNGETVSFNKQDIKIKKLSYLGYLQWKYIKHEKG